MAMIYLMIGFILVAIIFSLLWLMAVKGQIPKRVGSNFRSDLPYEDISFTSKGSRVVGWFIPSQYEKPQPLIIIVHGWASCRERMLRYVEPVHHAGYAVLLFDVRSHGESESTAAATGKIFRDDVIAAVQYAKSRPDVDADRIGILGHSVGGFGSILANRQDIGIQAVVADSMPVQFSTIMKALLQKYKVPYIPVGPILLNIMFWRAGISRKERKELNGLSAVINRKKPTLFIHSIHDDYVPSSELEYIVQHEEVEHFFVKTEGHRNSQEDPQFWSEVLPFLDRHVMKG
jgi:dipeptidyl aminopeptidase/acylaminoacyl peptidase